MRESVAASRVNMKRGTTGDRMVCSQRRIIFASDAEQRGGRQVERELTLSPELLQVARSHTWLLYMLPRAAQSQAWAGRTP